MSGAPQNPDTLRRLAERALQKGGETGELSELLVSLIDAVGDEGEHALFAHRHLAEVRIESDPWQAALHLRRVTKAGADDDVVHALMGLCQALLGNYRAAVSAYRRALSIEPRNPWYHHNLGHLLDVALSQPERAQKHLREAHRSEPREHEITASLAHCLARLGDAGHLAEALTLAEEALAVDPENKSHRDLHEWIVSGAAGGPSPRVEAGGAPARKSNKPGEVEQALTRGMQEAGFSKSAVARARALWADFHVGRRLRVKKPETYAAAVEYAITFVMSVPGVTKAGIARRYGIAPGSLSTRYGEIRDALELEPGDPRYA